MKKYEYFHEFVDDIVIQELRQTIATQNTLAKKSSSCYDKDVVDAAKVLLRYFT